MEFTATDGSNLVPFVLEVKVTSPPLVLTAEPRQALTAGPFPGESCQ